MAGVHSPASSYRVSSPLDASRPADGANHTTSTTARALALALALDDTEFSVSHANAAASSAPRVTVIFADSLFAEDVAEDDAAEPHANVSQRTSDRPPSPHLARIPHAAYPSRIDPRVAARVAASSRASASFSFPSDDFEKIKSFVILDAVAARATVAARARARSIQSSSSTSSPSSLRPASATTATTLVIVPIVAPDFGLASVFLRALKCNYNKVQKRRGKGARVTLTVSIVSSRFF